MPNIKSEKQPFSNSVFHASGAYDWYCYILGGHRGISWETAWDWWTEVEVKAAEVWANALRAHETTLARVNVLLAQTTEGFEFYKKSFFALEEERKTWEEKMREERTRSQARETEAATIECDNQNLRNQLKQERRIAANSMSRQAFDNLMARIAHLSNENIIVAENERLKMELATLKQRCEEMEEQVV